MVPVVLFTGFLGSGKTTLLNQLLAARPDGGRRWALVVNEFGDVGIDGDLLPAGQTRQVELPGGCICCQLDEDLEKTLFELTAEIADLETIVVETTGVAEPLPISWTLAREPLALRVRLAAIVTVVDAENHLAHRALSPTVDNQVEHADLLAISKLDLVPGRRDVPAELVRALRALNPQAPLLAAASPVELGAALWHALGDPGFGGRPAATSDETSEHTRAHAHTHPEFQSVALPIDDVLDLEILTDKLQELPPGFVRIKGIACMVDAERGQTTPSMMAFHRVGARVSVEPVAGTPVGKVVAIGPDVAAEPLAACIRDSVIRISVGGSREAARCVQQERPKSGNLRELLDELREGFTLYAPVLIRVHDDAAALESTMERTTTVNRSLDWGEQYTREYANEAFILLGPNNLHGRLDQPVTIGRSRTCDAKIENDSVSKVHASIVFDRGSGEYYVIDQNSRNGTCINGEPISAGVRSALWPGAYVSFGDAVFVFIDPPTLRKLCKLAV